MTGAQTIVLATPVFLGLIAPDGGMPAKRAGPARCGTIAGFALVAVA